MEVINTKTSVYSMLKPSILLVVMKEDAIVDVPEVQENYETALRMTKGKRYASLVDARAFATITTEARDYSLQPEMYEHVVGQAILITSLANRLLANFLIRFYKKNKSVEMRIFNDYHMALHWLKEKLTEEQANKKQALKSMAV
jgi:hypothetical protein